MIENTQVAAAAERIAAQEHTFAVNSLLDKNDIDASPLTKQESQSSKHLLPRLDVVDHMSNYDMARELCNGHITEHVKHSLSDIMSKSGPQQLRLAVRDINEYLIDMTKGLPRAYQMRLEYGVERNPKTGQFYYQVRLENKLNQVLDALVFTQKGK